LESNLGVKNSDPSKQVEFIQNQFKSIADYEKKVAANIETFIQSSLDNKSLQKINVFDNLLRKFKFIESDFDTLMDNKVDKNVYYDIIFKLKRYLEKIKNNIFSLEKSKALELYKNVSQLEYFFRTESEDVDVNVQNFIKSEAEEMKKNKQSDCKDLLTLLILKHINIILLDYSNYFKGTDNKHNEESDLEEENIYNYENRFNPEVY
ncbi:hypothetical protein CWI38_1287p0030, partial [Hamiltosporidium tvaerminnensis]